jgi:tetratricopeptide (TPR) repeat protein
MNANEGKPTIKKSAPTAGKPVLTGKPSQSDGATLIKKTGAPGKAPQHQEEPAGKALLGDVHEPLPGALEEVTKQLEEDPKNEDLHMRRYQILKKMNDKDKLTKALEEVAGFSENPFFAMKLADVYDERFDSANSYLWRKKVVEMKPADPYAIKRFAASAVRVRHLDEAEDAYRRLLSLREGDDDPLGHTFFQEMHAFDFSREERRSIQELGLRIIGDALTTRPDSIPLLEGAARLAAYASDLEASIAYYERLIAAEPMHPSIRQWKTDMLRILARLGLADKWKSLNNELIQDYARHLEREPGDSRSWMLLAHQQLNAGKTEDAIYSLKRSVSADSKNVQALYELGRLLVRLNRADEAVNYYLDILESNVSERKSFHRVLELSLADLYVKLGKYQEAFDIYVKEEEANARFLGMILEAVGNSSRAADFYSLAVDKYPRDARNHLAISEFFIRQGRWDDALSYAVQGLGCSNVGKETKENLYVAKASAHMKMNNLDEALETMNEAVDTSPDLPSMAFRKVKLLIMANRKEDGLKLCQEVIVRIEKQILCAPASSGLWSLLGDCCLVSGDHEKAEEAYVHALSFDAMDAAAVRGMGIILERKGEAAQAVEFYKRCILLEPLSLATPPIKQKIATLESSLR